MQFFSMNRQTWTFSCGCFEMRQCLYFKLVQRLSPQWEENTKAKSCNSAGDLHWDYIWHDDTTYCSLLQHHDHTCTFRLWYAVLVHLFLWPTSWKPPGCDRHQWRCHHLGEDGRQSPGIRSIGVAQTPWSIDVGSMDTSLSPSSCLPDCQASSRAIQISGQRERCSFFLVGWAWLLYVYIYIYCIYTVFKYSMYESSEGETGHASSFQRNLVCGVDVLTFGRGSWDWGRHHRGGSDGRCIVGEGLALPW